MNQKEILKILGETDPVRSLPCIKTVNTVPIYSAEVGFFVEVEVLNTISPSLLTGLRLICQSNSPIDIQGQVGWYHKLFKVAWVHTGDRSSIEISRSILHEVGHHIWGMLTEGDRLKFAAATKKLKGGCNDWSVPEERFADAVALVFLNNAKLPVEIKNQKICQQLLTCYQNPDLLQLENTLKNQNFFKR